MNSKASKSNPVRTDLDDWETDPDFVRDMDEMDQRWGNRRTVGSINMNKLIDDVRKDHQLLREKFDHPSQRDHSDGFGGKFGVQSDRKDQSAHDYDYHEKLSKHTSQEISRRVITSSVKGNLDEAKRNFLERSSQEDVRSKQPSRSSSAFGSQDRGLSGRTSASPRFEESSSSKSFVREEKTSSSSKLAGDMPPAFKSIQEKIDAFKRDFEDIESKVAKKSDLAKVITRTSNVEKRTNVEYVSRGGDSNSTPERVSSASPTSFRSESELPKKSIKSLSEKFETLCRESSEDFKRRTELKRKEYFDQIKNQVRETRKDLDGFDSIDEDYDTESKFSRNLTGQSPSSPGSHSASQSEWSLSGKPKIYTRRETTQEKIVSKIVKENDKIIENETKRNVERSSSVHGSSDDEEPANSGSQAHSIRVIEQELRSSPSGRQHRESPVEKLERKIPVVEPDLKGPGLMARTLYDYKAADSDELSFDVDDLITNIEKVHQDWYKGTITSANGSKQVGLFPANYVRLLNDTNNH